MTKAPGMTLAASPPGRVPALARVAGARGAACRGPRRAAGIPGAWTRAGLTRADLRLVFVLFPLASAIYILLTDWPLIWPIHFIGLSNYQNRIDNWCSCSRSCSR